LSFDLGGSKPIIVEPSAALCVPNDSFRQITAWRSDRSPALFVGSTPS
jgi:hypothetical protein